MTTSPAAAAPTRRLEQVAPPQSSRESARLVRARDGSASVERCGDVVIFGNRRASCARETAAQVSNAAELRIWGRCSLRQDGKLNHVDRAGHPSVSSFFNTDDTKLEYNASEPVNDRKRWLEQFVHLMGHTGNYSREEAIAEIDREGTLPDVLSFNPSKAAKYPNGRVFTDDVIDYRLAFLTKGECPPSGLKPHSDVLKEFPYLGTPHQKKS